MSRRGTELWYRLVIALIGAVWLGVGARPALALGCHVRERPALGFLQPWESAPTARLPLLLARAASLPGLVPVPCTDDLPGSSPRVPTRTVAVAAGSVVPERAGEARLVDPSSPPPRPCPLPWRLDRPPRAARAVA